ncbi:MAG TPA: glutaredoxin family protein [Candidatus Limnocylindrales bacterium]|nr:glutaredoxin family protein [Candidatus Limnocylindrales bacterium]
MLNVTLYSKKECHLCDIAKEELTSIQREFDFSIKEVDIEKDTLVFEKFKHLIPVVEVDGMVISTGRVNGKKIKDILKQKSQLE